MLLMTFLLSLPLFLGGIILFLWIYDLYCQWKKKISFSEVKSATIGCYPLIGNLFDFQRSTSYKSLANYPKLYGPLVQFSIVHMHGLLVTNLKLAKEILARRPKKFYRPSILHYANDRLQLSTGLLNADGSMWSRIRKATAPSFSMLNITHKLEKINEEMISWVERLHQSQQNNESIDMKYESFTLTIRVITAVAFGLDPKNPQDLTSQTYFFSNTFKQDVEKIFRFIRETAMFGFPRWMWSYLPYYYGFEVRALEANQRFTEACQTIIQQKRLFWKALPSHLLLDTTIKSNEQYPTSMLDSLLRQEYQHKAEAEAKNDPKTANNPSYLMNDEELMANVKTFYLAGSDTTSVTITWLTYFCGQYPVYVEKVRQEALEKLFSESASLSSLSTLSVSDTSVKAVLQSLRQSLSSITIDRIKTMTFTTALIKETLRLRSPLASVAVEVATTTDSDGTDKEGQSPSSVTLSNGMTIPSGITVWVNQDGLHRLPEVFDDPLTFNPYRWFMKLSDKETEAEFQQRLEQMESHFLPFGSGPRICPGMNLAMYEAVLAIAFLAVFFQIELACPVEEIERIPNLVATASKMPIKLIPRYRSEE